MEGKKEYGRNKKRKIKHGNYKGYYGFRLGVSNETATQTIENDPRMKVLQPQWFSGKKCLDIGCNSGLLTIEIAKQLQPAYMLGIDLDQELITTARRNIKEQLLVANITEGKPEIAVANITEEKPEIAVANITEEKPEVENDVVDNDDHHFIPLSFKLWKSPTLDESSYEPLGSSFPLNVGFKHEDFVKDDHIGTNYDVITLFSVSKWIHLLHGDEGMKKVFHKIFNLLSPKGVFVFEPQKWKSYHKRKYTSKESQENYEKIQLRPSEFSSFLLNEVGFESFELLDTCRSSTRGFVRSVYKYIKPGDG